MGSGDILIQPLTREAFAPYGDILELNDEPTMIINQGMCGRHHDLAKLDFVMTEEDDGRPGISLFNAQPRSLPYRLDLVERHPLGSQAFVPMSLDPFLVIVAPDEKGEPGRPLAFETRAGQGINFHRDTWHGVLTPLHAPGLFAVIDRIGTAKTYKNTGSSDPTGSPGPDKKDAITKTRKTKSNVLLEERQPFQ